MPALLLVATVHALFGAALWHFGALTAPRPAPARPTVVELLELAPTPEPEPLPDVVRPPATVDPIFVPPPLVALLPSAPPLATSSVPDLPQPPNRVPTLPTSTPAEEPAAPPSPAAPIVPADAFAEGLDNPSPRYPLESRRLREQGTVILTVEVTAEGRVAAIEISSTSGHARLDEAALQTVRRWRFRPATQAGQPVAARGIVEIPFVLARH